VDELIKQKLAEQDISSEIIRDILKVHSDEMNRMKGMYRRYKQKDLAIQERSFPDPTKLNNKMPNDYRGDIVVQVNGYLFGQPLSYQIEGNEQAQEIFRDFRLRNHLEDLDAETGKMMSVCGRAARLCYIHDGEEWVMNVPPWETIFIYDASIDQAQYAMRAYPVVVKEGDTKVERWRVEWYDSEYVTFFIEDRRGEFVLDPSKEDNPLPHLFDFVPLMEFVNNEEALGDFEKVEDLIDAYDRLVSDVQNEIEEFRLAYLLFVGGAPDADEIKKFRQTGAVEVPEDGDVRFLTKDIIDTVIENHKRTLNDNIYKFSGTVDMSSEAFSGTSASGESRKWRMLALENKCSVKERKFSKALRRMFEVIASAWQKKGYAIDHTEVSWDFKRNVPLELRMEAEFLQLTAGHVSDKTRFGQVSFVEDPEEELNRMQEQREAYNVTLEEDDDDEG